MVDIDQRLLRVTLRDENRVREFSGIAIAAEGYKYAGIGGGRCTISLTNLTREAVNQIATETSPYNQFRNPLSVTLEAGRESFGYTLVFLGDTYRSSVGQPPDTSIDIRCITGFSRSGTILSIDSVENRTLSNLSQDISNRLGLTLDFQANDKILRNFSFSGALSDLPEELESVGGIDVFEDGGRLIVRNKNEAVTGRGPVLTSSDIIGIPEQTEQGAKVTFFFTPTAQVGGPIRIESTRYPYLNGDYQILKLSFQLTNRDTAFYYTADCGRF